MVDTDQISTSADEPGLVIRNEDVFLEKVRERVALARATGHLLSPVLLLQTAHGDDLQAALAAAADAAGAPAVTRHSTRPGVPTRCGRCRAGPTQDEILALAGGGELVVADGNHRSLAAQTAGLPRFLAVVTTPGSVAIQPYNRLVSELTVPADDLLARLRAAGARVTPGDAPGSPPGGARSSCTARRCRLRRRAAGRRRPAPSRGQPGPRAGRAGPARATCSGWTPGDKRITYVGGDYPAAWLVGEVDAGRAELAVLIAPVTVDDFVAVNLAR